MAGIIEKLKQFGFYILLGFNLVAIFFGAGLSFWSMNATLEQSCPIDRCKMRFVLEKFLIIRK